MTETTAWEPKQRMSAAARRSQLLDVALEKFAGRGYHDTSMGEIAVAAGVTKPVLYQHFQSKEELYRELLDTVGDELLTEVEGRVASESGPYDRVVAGFRAYFTFVCHRPTAFRLLFGGGARTAEEFGDSVRSVEERVAETVGQMIVADLDEEHRELLGYAIVGLAEVVGRKWAATDPLSDQPPIGASTMGTINAANGIRQSSDAERETERLATRLADFVWAGLRGLPAPASGQRVAGGVP